MVKQHLRLAACALLISAGACAESESAAMGADFIPDESPTLSQSYLDAQNMAEAYNKAYADEKRKMPERLGNWRKVPFKVVPPRKKRQLQGLYEETASLGGGVWTSIELEQYVMGDGQGNDKPTGDMYIPRVAYNTEEDALAAGGDRFANCFPGAHQIPDGRWMPGLYPNQCSKFQSVFETRTEAEVVGFKWGCQGAHQMMDGLWMPGENHGDCDEFIPSPPRPGFHPKCRMMKVGFRTGWFMEILGKYYVCCDGNYDEDCTDYHGGTYSSNEQSNQ